MSPDELTIDHVRAAATRLVGKVWTTPVIRCPALDRIAGRELFLKAENLQRVGAFKARGAMHAVSRLDPDTRARGIVTYSSGNHAQAVALAARLERVDEATLMRLCVIESGGCRRVGVHSRARPNVARRPGLGAWVKAVRVGILRPSDARLSVYRQLSTTRSPRREAPAREKHRQAPNQNRRPMGSPVWGRVRLVPKASERQRGPRPHVASVLGAARLRGGP